MPTVISPETLSSGTISSCAAAAAGISSAAPSATTRSRPGRRGEPLTICVPPPVPWHRACVMWVPKGPGDGRRRHSSNPGGPLHGLRVADRSRRSDADGWADPGQVFGIPPFRCRRASSTAKSRLDGISRPDCRHANRSPNPTPFPLPADSWVSGAADDGALAGGARRNVSVLLSTMTVNTYNSHRAVVFTLLKRSMVDFVIWRDIIRRMSAERAAVPGAVFVIRGISSVCSALTERA